MREMREAEFGHECPICHEREGFEFTCAIAWNAVKWGVACAVCGYRHVGEFGLHSRHYAWRLMAWAVALEDMIGAGTVRECQA